MRIAVYCGSSSRVAESHLAVARELGGKIARRGHVLVYGGGRTGLMGEVADGALRAGGTVRGVILRDFVERDTHHRGLHELHVVEDMRSRKAGLDESAEAFVALPGGLGTLEELAEILSFRKLSLHDRRLTLLNTGGYYDPLIAQIERAIAEGFERQQVRDFFVVADAPVEAVARCEEWSAPGRD